MNKRLLNIIEEALENFSIQYPEDSGSSGYGFDSELNKPVNSTDSNHSMKHDNIASVYFTESEEDYYSGEGEEEEKNKFLFDDFDGVEDEFNEDMLDISTPGKKMDLEIPPGGEPISESFIPELMKFQSIEGFGCDDSEMDGRYLDYKEENEGGMMNSNLYNINQDVEALMSMIRDNDDIPQWALEKIAVARDKINSVREYLESKISEY